MVVKPIRPDDHKQVRRGRYITILHSQPEPVTADGRPVIVPNEEEGMSVMQATNSQLYGFPLQVLACEWPFIVCKAMANTDVMRASQIVRIDTRTKTLGFVSPKYARSFL